MKNKHFIIIRGTTPTLTFNLPIDLSIVSDILVSFGQDNRIVFSKKMDQLRVADDGVVTLILTQQETKLFKGGEYGEPRWGDCQVRILTTTGYAPASFVIKFAIFDVVDDRILGDLSPSGESVPGYEDQYLDLGMMLLSNISGYVQKGRYDEETEYQPGDVINYGGSSYVAKRKTKGTVPSADDEYWQLVAASGSGVVPDVAVISDGRWVQNEDSVDLKLKMTQLVEGSTTTITRTLNAATDEKAGVMTPEQVQQLADLGEDKLDKPTNDGEPGQVIVKQEDGTTAFEDFESGIEVQIAQVHGEPVEDDIKIYIDSTESEEFIVDDVPTENSTHLVSSGGVYRSISQSSIIVDTAVSPTSTNPVQNKVLKKYVDDADTAIRNTLTQDYPTKAELEAVKTAKQDKLTAGDNIDISGSTIKVKTDSAMSDTSTQPIQNKVVKSYVDTTKQEIIQQVGQNYSTKTELEAVKTSKQDKLTAGEAIDISGSTIKVKVDTTVSDTSTNPVQNKVVKKYVDDTVAGYVKTSDVEQTFNKTSANPQSGKAVQGAIDLKLDKPTNVGTVGQFLTKTATGSEWKEVSVDVDQTFDGNSTNAQSGKAIKPELDKKQDTLTAGEAIDISGSTIKVKTDTAMSDTSTQPIQNKVVKKYVDDSLENYVKTEDVQQTFNETSTDPQSGKAVKEAIDLKLDKPTNTGAVDQVLMKTATGSEWKTVSVEVDQTFDGTSEKAQSGKAIKPELDKKQNELTAGDSIDITNDTIKVKVDTSMSDTSTQPVQNKVAKKYVDDALEDYVKTEDIDQAYGETSENAQSGKAVKEAIDTRIIKPTNDTTATAGQVLAKTATGTEWKEVSVTVDQTFDGTSENAQSGKAIKVELDKKQDELTAGDNIDITNDTIKVKTDTAMSATSTQPVQNKVIKAYVDDTLEDYIKTEDIDQTFGATSENAQSGKAIKTELDKKQDELTAGDSIDITGTTIKVKVDTAMSDSSTQPVQNKVAKKYVDDALEDYVKTEDVQQSFDKTSEDPQSGKAVQEAIDLKLDKPENTGAIDQILTKTATGSKWTDTPTVDQVYNETSENAQSGKAVKGALDDKMDEPENTGTVGQMLVKISTGSEWKDVPTVDQTFSATSENAQSGKAIKSVLDDKFDKPTNTGTATQILTKTATGSEWKDAPVVDQTFGATSTNAQSGVAIKAELDKKQDKLTAGNHVTIADDGTIDVEDLTIDTSMSDTSTNTVQNKVVKQYVDDKFDGAAKAVAFNNYAEMVAHLSTAAKTLYKTGQDIYVVTREVPDVWVTKVVDTPVAYTYTTDAALIEYMGVSTYGGTIGYYMIAPLETEKVDLTQYVAKSEVDTAIDATSTDPVQNKVIKVELDKKQDTLIEGDYIEIDADNKISVDADVNEVQLAATSTEAVADDTKIYIDPAEGQFEQIDERPTKDSTHLVLSGGVFAAFEDTIGKLHEEEWTFTLDDDTTVVKKIAVWSESMYRNGDEVTY